MDAFTRQSQTWTRLRWSVASGALLALLIAAAPPARGLTISLDQDSFASGTDISNAFPGATLTAQGPLALGPVHAYTHPVNSTSGNIYGYDCGNFTCKDWSTSTLAELRIDILSGASAVTVDCVNNGPDLADQCQMEAFDASNSSLGSVVGTPNGGTGSVDSMNIDFGSGNDIISYVVIGTTPSGGYVHLDNARIEQVPEPATITLLPILLLAAAFRVKRRSG